jgi:putative transposase
VLRRPVESAQYTSLTYTDRLDELEIAPSVGSRGDAYDTAMAEAWVATFKNELVDGRRFPSFEHAEHEVLEWIGFYNDERLHEALGDLPPAEYEELNIKTDNTQRWLPTNTASSRPRVDQLRAKADRRTTHSRAECRPAPKAARIGRLEP